VAPSARRLGDALLACCCTDMVPFLEVQAGYFDVTDVHVCQLSNSFLDGRAGCSRPSARPPVTEWGAGATDLMQHVRQHWGLRSSAQENSLEGRAGSARIMRTAGPAPLLKQAIARWRARRPLAPTREFHMS